MEISSKTRKRYRGILLQKSIAAVAIMAICGTGVAMAADTSQDALLEVLIRKGVLTRQEAEEVRKEVKAQEEQTRAKITEEAKDKATPKALKDLKVEALGYVDYSAGEKGLAGNAQDGYNKFTLTRGYLTVQKGITPWLGARATTDIYQDTSTIITGVTQDPVTNKVTTKSTTDTSWKLRLKYLYGELKPGDLGPFTEMKSEVGLGHVPWLDFEEHVNPYRAQGTMPIERAGVFNSADLGVSLMGNFGGKLADAKTLTGNSAYDGLFGSWHLGIYNGGGYNASENNDNKVVEGRLTVRPLPAVAPGLQLSYFGLDGKGNISDNAPDYIVNMGMLSYEHPRFTLTGQYFTTKGDAKGDWVKGSEALDTAGYSFFGNLVLPVLDDKLSAFARYDHFDGDQDADIAQDATYDLAMGGLAYDIYKGNLVLVDYETISYGDDSGGMGKTPVAGNRLGDDTRVQVVYQLKF